MKNERPINPPAKVRSLDERLLERPDLTQSLHGLIDEMEESLASGARADDVEERVQEQVRKVGLQAFSAWAAQAQEQTSAQTPARHPGAVKHAKKNSSGKRSSARSKSRSKSGG
jgi:hypothetical protein